jgi:hypothetical protein
MASNSISASRPKVAGPRNADLAAVGTAVNSVAAILPDLLTSKECAAYRRCSVRKLDRERAERRGCPYVRIDGRIFYRRADVDRFIESHLRLTGRASSTSEESAA